jgi:hypothetical protein
MFVLVAIALLAQILRPRHATPADPTTACPAIVRSVPGPNSVAADSGPCVYCLLYDRDLGPIGVLCKPLYPSVPICPGKVRDGEVFICLDQCVLSGSCSF